MALLDVMIAATVLAVALTSMMTLIVSSVKLGRVNRENTLANEAARRQLEVLHSADFDTLFTAFTAAPDFAVRGLAPQPGDPDGMAGQILFPSVGAALREDVNDPGLGMPRDLNGDGVIDFANHAGDYQVLPVRVRISWRGISGARSVDLTTLVMDW
jgi:type II secretory pathway pseudopilin PulG